MQKTTLTTNSVHCLSVFSGDLGSPLLFSLTKNLSLYTREERQRTHSEMNCEGGEQERSENKVSRMSSTAERREATGEKRLQSTKCEAVCESVGGMRGRDAREGGNARQNGDVSIASDDKSVKWRDEIFKTLRLRDNLFDPDRTASAKKTSACRGGLRRSQTLGCELLSMWN